MLVGRASESARIDSLLNEVRGGAVRITERMLAHAGASEVLVTQTVRDAVYGSSLAFTARGDVELAGAGTWNLFIAIPG